MEIKIFKGKKQQGVNFSIGLGGEDSLAPEIEHMPIHFPVEDCFAVIRDGEIQTPLDGTYTILNSKTREPVPLQKIVWALFNQNQDVKQIGKRGIKSIKSYGQHNRWFFDYEPELEEFFVENNIPLPADKKSYFSTVLSRKPIGLMSEEEKGMLVRGMGGAQDGVAAIEAAKAKKELQKQQVELEAMKAELEAIKASTIAPAPVVEEVKEPPEGIKKKPGRKKKEELVT